jgi:hypothetical protein
MLLECFVVIIKALSHVPPVFLKPSQFSLRFGAVTMTADRFNIIHATIANSGFNRIFASFLIIPDQTGTATRHDTRRAIICSNQAQIGLILAQQTIVFFLWIARHYIIDPRRHAPGRGMVAKASAAWMIDLNQETLLMSIPLTIQQRIRQFSGFGSAPFSC